jgi:hypothetical protein
MNYEEVWKILADLFTDLKQKGENIPTNIMEDLRSAKTMIQILKSDPTHVENLPRIETYLGNVESYLINVAKNKSGKKNAEHWLKTIEEARKKVPEKKETKTPLQFVPGLPRGKNWMRIQISKDTPRKSIETLANKIGLSYKIQENGYVLVYGNEEKIRAFIKRVAERFRKSETMKKL